MMIRNKILMRYMVMLLLMTVGVCGAWGQTGTDRSGIFYFANGGSGKTPDAFPEINDPTLANITNPDDYFYLVPADNPQQDDKRDAWFSSDYSEANGDSEKPYLTTYKTKKDAAAGVTNRPHNSVWIVKFAMTETVNNKKTNYYYLIHAATGKYVVYEPPYTTKNNRKSVHLQDSPVDDALFAITTHPITINSINYDCYNFRPKKIGTGGSTNKYLNAANANYNYYYSNDKTADGAANYYFGLVGLWKDAGGGSDWKPEATLLDAPTISEVDANNKVTITDANSLPSGYEIRYTTDGSTPTASTGTVYSGPIPITASVTIKAVVVRYGMVLTEVASETREPAPCAKPIITFDYTNSKVSIECATDGSTIYYTTDGSTPTTSSTPYSSSFFVDGPTTVKAIATHATFDPSSVAELAISQVATPIIQNNGSNAISITTTTPDATIYYTTDGSTPTPSNGTEYTVPLTENVSNVTIKAIAVKENMITSAVGSGSVKLQCATPVITREGLTFTLSCSFPTDANLYYTLGSGSEVAYTGTPVSFTSDQLPMTLTAVARHSDYTESETASMELKNGTGTSDDPYLIYGATDFANFVTNVNNGTTSSACYKLGSDVSASGMDAITAFTGTFDGNGYTISNLGHALFNTVNGGVVKNVILDNVSISGGTNVGAICNEATGDSRIYNCGVLASGSTAHTDTDGYTYLTGCSSTVSGSNYVGGIVGLLDGSSRVINCFSYANVSGGSYVGGIVGYNNVATTASNLQTMVMNCMFYGEVSGSSIAPIYNGEIITNDGDENGVNNFNYFRLESSYIQNTGITKVYNCALGAETRFLQRFEFYRHLLNSNRELAAWWATGSPNNKDEMMKWVLEPSQIGSPTPYPILKTPYNDEDEIIKYPSVVNIDAENAPLATERNKGGKLGSLSVTIQSGNGEYFNAPSGASIIKTSLTLNITDKDFDHFNFNYYKVQLPYYNEVGTGNYTENRVVTGWKIVSVTTDGSVTDYNDFTTGDDAPAYNFADRQCTAKDIYSNDNKRVFNQGAYWDVPEGVTAITIQPYWANAVYLSDAYLDVTYQNGTNSDVTKPGSIKDAMTTPVNVTTVGGGQRYENGKKYNLATHSLDETNGQAVYTNIGDAIASTALYAGTNETTYSARSVYDYAVVLVGNYHHTGDIAGGGKPYTVTSVDMDGDNEPDYSLMLRFNGRIVFHPVRYDFLNLIGLGMAQKTTGGTGSYNLGIMQPKYWFETTNTSLFRVTQFEYDRTGRVAAPYIVQGGVMEQWVSGQNNGAANNITYFYVGGNVWFKEFHRGTHQDKQLQSKHPPVSVTGGDYDEFYLTGLYRADVTSYEDNAECYINGGRFGVVAGAAMEGIGKANGADNTGNITWQVQNADIAEFYGGGINADKPVQGNITTTITGGKIDLFCGGPKFGDMSTGKTVTTTATGCTFGTFFGAGYGGSSYSRRAPSNIASMLNMPGTTNDKKTYDSWNAWVKAEYKQMATTGFPGISTRFNYQFIPNSDNVSNVGRLFVEHVKFSLATTHEVSSTLTGCTITGNFYGGGNLGKVNGSVTSTLTDCTVNGNVFGAGYSASLPTVEVDSIGFRVEPYYYENLGTFRSGAKGNTTTYTWAHGNAISIDTGNKILYTTEYLDGLGAVTGNVTLNIDGTTTVGESVYGGGEESGVGGNTTVTVNSGRIGVGNTGTFGYRWGNVYGGGKGKIEIKSNGTSELVVSSIADLDAGQVKGNTTVTINGTTTTTQILHNVYGGGAVGSVGTFTRDAQGMPTACDANTGLATVTINGGTIGHNHQDTGMVNGSSRGWEGNPNGTGAFAFLNQLAWVNNTNVTIGSSTSSNEDKGPTIYGSIYGGGENGHNFENGVVTVYKGTIGDKKGTWDCGNIYGAGCGTDIYTIGDDPTEHRNPMAGIVRGTTTITVNGGHVLRNVYGGGSMGSVGTYTYDANGLPTSCASGTGNATININGGTIGETDTNYGYVFGGPRGNLSETEYSASVRETQVNINAGADVKGSVFGGGEAGIVRGNVVVNMKGGEVRNDIYGGGALANTNTDNWDDTANSGAGGWASGKYDSTTGTTTYTTTVNLHGGTVGHNVYGGGLGQKYKAAVSAQDEVGTPGEGGYQPAVAAQDEVPAIEAFVYGDVLVKLNETPTVTNNPNNCVVKGVIHGANNYNGTPKGDVTVHVWKTQGWTDDKGTADTSDDISHDVSAGKLNATVAKGTGVYELLAVYGGGNEAAYVPVSNASVAHVIIDGCSLTSIETVYGGGNAASAPATYVEVNSCYEIGTMFGGGNGKDALSDGSDNPGANVGYLADGNTTYGTGVALAELHGGTIHKAFGGSNTKGNVRTSATVTLDETDPEGCPLCIEEVYGAGNEANQDGTSNINLGCLSFLSEIYGGAKNADINSDVVLTIQSGRFNRVFGGNNIGGCIRGSITVNIEETGCHPIVIGQLFGGGNQAGYSIYGYDSNGNPVDPTSSSTPLYADPQVNVKSFTSIGDVYGGGYGSSATMVGNPYVRISECVGENANIEMKSGSDVSEHTGEWIHFLADPEDQTNIVTVWQPEHKSGAIGSIGNVFGGGNAADVHGNTNVYIGTLEYVEITTNLTDVRGYYTRSGSDYTIVTGPVPAAAGTTYYQRVTSGNTETYNEVSTTEGVTDVSNYYTRSGDNTQESPYVYTLVTIPPVDGTSYYKPVIGVNITGNVYGGGNAAVVTGNTNVLISTEEPTTTP